MTIRQFIHQILAKFNLELKILRPVTNNSLQISQFIIQNGFDIVLDIGANEGQFAQHLFATGYKGRIVSFEPLPEQYLKLINNASMNKNWLIGPQIALGSKKTQLMINVSGMHASSSLLKISRAHTTAFSGSSTVKQLPVDVLPLDSIQSSYLDASNKVFIKIDTQGYESEVLIGATNTLNLASAVLVEVSLVELYEGQFLMNSIFEYMSGIGFKPFIIQQCTVNPLSLQTLQLDVLFVRNGFNNV